VVEYYLFLIYCGHSERSLKMGKKTSKSKVPLLLLGMFTLAAGYVAGSYVGIDDVNDLMTGLSSPEMIKTRAAALKAKSDSSQLAKQKKLIERKMAEKKKVEAQMAELKKKSVASAKAKAELKKKEDLRKKIDAQLVKQKKAAQLKLKQQKESMKQMSAVVSKQQETTQAVLKKIN
jgi:hypothetical protein